MMNKIRRLILSATILAAAFGALGVLHACAGKTVEKEYTAYYGETFTLPGISGATYALSDSDGNAVDVSSGNFLPTDLDGYTLRVNEKGKKYSIKINVAERNAPFISVDRKTVYATVGKQTALPVFRATDGVTGKELPVTVQVTSPDGKVEAAGESFVPERAGEYVVTASAAGENGVGAERTAIVMAKEGLNYANVLAPMAEERGTETIADTFGVIPSYNTDDDFTYGSEGGSLKLVSNMEGNVYFGFRLKNLVRSDITGFKGFYFYLFNDSPINFTLCVNWGWEVTCTAGEWTRVSVTDYDGICENSGNSVIKEYFSSENINGMTFSCYYSANGAWQGLPSVEMYLSNVYLLPDVTPDYLNEYADEFPDVSELSLKDEESLRLQIEEFETLYDSLSEYERCLVNYGKVAAVRTGLLKLRHPDTETDRDTVVYFNSEMGLDQAEFSFNPKGDKVEASLSTDMYYGDEGASTKISWKKAGSIERWDLNVKFTDPFVYNFMTDYDTWYVYIYNASDEDYGYYAWADNGVGWTQPLKKGKWNLVYLTDWSTVFGGENGAFRGNISDSMLKFAINPWSANEGGTFYLSCVKGLNASTVDDMLADDDATGTNLARIVSLYDVLSPKSQRAVNNYEAALASKFNAVCDSIGSRLAVADESALPALWEEIEAIKNVYVFSSSAVQKAVAEKYVAVIPAYINRCVEVTDVANADLGFLSDVLFAYALLGGAERQNVNVQFENFYASAKTRFGVTGGSVAAFGEACGRYQAAFREQYDTGEVDEDWNKIFVLSPFDGTFEFTDKRSYAGQSGSTALTIAKRDGWNTLNMYLVLPSVSDAGSSDYDAVFFYVYNESAEDYRLEVGNSLYFTLKANAWTKVYINEWAKVYDGISRGDIRGLRLNIHCEADWNLATDAVLYFSSLLPANADTVNEMIESLGGNPTLEELSRIRGIYEMLSENQKSQTAYESVALRIMQKLADAYGTEIDEKEKAEIISVYAALSAGQQSGDVKTWYDEFYAREILGVIAPGDTNVTYYGKALGMEQVSLRFGTDNGTSATNVIPEVSFGDKTVYGEDTIRITSAATYVQWEHVYLTVKNPTIKDISGAQGIYTYIYNNMNFDIFVQMWPNRWTLKAKSWNMLMLDKDSLPWVNAALGAGATIDPTSIDDKLTFKFFYYVGVTVQMTSGLDIYVSPFKTVTAEEINGMIGALDAITSESEAMAAGVVEMYENSDAAEREKIVGYEAFRTRYAQYLKNRYGFKENALVHLGENGGSAQIFTSIDGGAGSDVAMSEKPVYTTAVAYGNEKGSTVIKQGEFTASSKNVWYNLTLSVPDEDVYAYRKIYFYVYNDSNYDYTVTYNGQTVHAKAKTWVRVEFEIDASSSENITMQISFGKQLERTAIYFSSIYGEK